MNLDYFIPSVSDVKLYISYREAAIFGIGNFLLTLMRGVKIADIAIISQKKQNFAGNCNSNPVVKTQNSFRNQNEIEN